MHSLQGQIQLILVLLVKNVRENFSVISKLDKKALLSQVSLQKNGLDAYLAYSHKSAVAPLKPTVIPDLQECKCDQFCFTYTKA